MFLNDALFESLGLPQLLPASLAAWRPLVSDGMKFFLTRLPAHRVQAIVVGQLALPEDADAAARLVSLLLQCPTLHKLGQVLARNRQLPRQIRLGLQTLESMLPSTPMEQVLERIHEELPHHSLQLAPQSLAEGSVAVVLPFTYRENGKTRDGVLKVLKPGIEDKFTEELGVWLELGAFLEERGRALGLTPLDYRGTLDSVRELLSNEIHLEVEQRNLRDAAMFYADEPRLLIPRLLPWCTHKLTAMERIVGDKVTDAELSPQVRAEFAGLMVSTLIGQPFWSREETAVLHADLHAGNLFATQEGRLAVLDWSLILHLSMADRRALVSIILGGLTLDAARIRREVAALGAMPEADPVLSRAVERALDRVVFQHCFPGFEWLLEMLDELARDRVTGFREDFVLFRKTWFSLAGVIDDLVERHSPDTQLLGLGFMRFLEELPLRLSAPPESARFSSHISNADILRICASGWLVSMRYWMRFWRIELTG